jgi:hypothetical protein
MAPPDLYTIDGKKLQLSQIISQCEKIAKANKDGKRYFVGRETIRGRLRCGVRTWIGLTSKTKTHSERVKGHSWRGKTPGAAFRPHPDDSVYEPEDYVGPDELADKY